MAAVETRARAMGSEVLVLAHGRGAEGVGERVVARIEELEEQWSRFRPAGDLTALNSAAGTPQEVSPDTLVLVDALVRAWSLTGGLCDASVLPAVLAAGYDRSTVDGRTDGSGGARPERGPAPGLGGVVIDPTARLVTLPVGVALDPGAIGKGLAADLVAVEAVLAGTEGVLVSIGGDLRAGGQPPDGGWPVIVESAWDQDVAATALRVAAGGVATSSTLSRRWHHDGEERHHVLDPRLGVPAPTDLASATIVASTAWEAEALATAAMVQGTARAYASLVVDGVGGVLQTVGGGVVLTPDLAVDGVSWPRVPALIDEAGR